MNKNILFVILFFCLFIVTNITAQEDNYESIFGEETTLRSYYTYDYFTPFSEPGVTSFYSDHTTVYDDYNDQEYYRVELGWVDEDSGEFTNTYEEEDFMWLREDTSTGKVWMVITILEDDEDEVLVMDMSLEVGDFFEFTPSYEYPGGSNETQELEVIDVYYENDRKHIVFDYAHDWDAPDFDIPEEHQTLVFIEGVGASLNFPIDFGYLSFISCVQKDGDQVYESNLEDLADQCVIANLSANDFEEDLSFSLYPNPAQEYIYIELSSGNSFSVDLYDINGKLVLQNQTNQQELDISELSSGIYLVKITDQTTGASTTKKLVKQ